MLDIVVLTVIWRDPMAGPSWAVKDRLSLEQVPYPTYTSTTPDVKFLLCIIATMCYTHLNFTASRFNILTGSLGQLREVHRHQIMQEMSWIMYETCVMLGVKQV